MKEFLRYLFVVATMLMVVVGDVWAECYYGIDNLVTEINTNNHSEKEWWGTNTYYKFASTTEIGSVNNTYGISKITATITLERTNGGKNAKVKLEYSVNGGSWISLGGEKELAGTKVAWETDNKLEVSQNVDIPAGNTVKFRICETKQEEYGGSRKLTISNFNVTIASTMTAIPSSIDFGVINYGETPSSKSFKIAFSNIGTNVSASSDTEHFRVSSTLESIDCTGEKSFSVTYVPKNTGKHSGKITVTSLTTGKSVSVNVYGTAKGAPEHSWNGSTEYYVDESIDLSSLWWTSNSEKAPSYAIEKFVVEDETGVTPSINNDGKSIKLTRAGKLTVKIIQDASETYSALSTTQEITIKKYPSNFAWKNPDNLQCHVDDFCDCDFLFSRSSDIPLDISSSNETAVVYDKTTGIFTAVCAGASTITIKQEKHYKWTEFEKTYTIHVNKYDVSASLKQANAALNELIDNEFTVDHDLQDYDVESLNPDIAKYIGYNKIQTYFTEGTALFRVTRAEDCKYKKLDMTLNLNVNKSGEVCVLYNTVKDYEYKVGYNDNKEGFNFDLGGEGANINIELKKQNAATDGGYIYIICYNALEEEVKRFSVKNTEISTSWGKYSFNISSYSVTKINVRSSADWYHDALNKYFRNLNVTRKKELDHQVAGNVLVLDPVNIGQTSLKSFNLKWSTCADEIVLVSDNDLFELNTTSINASNGGGSTNIQVTFKGSTTPGTYQAMISIYDQTQVTQLKVTCEVKEKLATTIHYTGAYQYSEGHDCLTGLFYVQDEVPNVVEGAVVKLSSSNEDILEICEDGTSFIPHCGGAVTLTATYEGDEYRAGATWEGTIIVANCTQKIEWDQNFKNYVADKNGSINESRILTAYAAPTNFNITYELDAAAEEFADLVETDGVWSLVVTGVGTGHIIAHAPEGEYNKQMYDAASVMHEIRVREEGEKCNTDITYISSEVTLSKVLSWFYEDEITIPLENRPYERMEFYTHVNSNSYSNNLTVSFSTDEGQTWVYPMTTYTDIPESYDWNQPYLYENIPSGATHVKFSTTSTACTYINMMKMVQKSYLTSDVDEILVEETGINIPFEKTFTIDYSDVNIIQYSVTNTHGMGLTLTPMSEINNDCGAWGIYDFKLTGTCTRPIAEGENIVESITLSTSDGKLVTIPVYILSNTFYFDVQDGNWTESSNWTYQGTTTHGKLPDLAHPSVISKAATITAAEGTYEATTYGVTIEGGSVAIKSTGGLTVGEGGVVAATDGLITIDNTPTGAGFLKVDPRATNKPSSKVTINYTTNAYNSGNPRDEIWQYMGAPGEGMQMSDADATMIYHWSEQNGWVKQSGASLTPFYGYAFTQSKGQPAKFTVNATPIIPEETIMITLSATPIAEGGMGGSNVFVNSFLAPIDLATFTGDDFEGNVDQTFYLFNSGSWHQWQEKGGKDHMEYGVSPGQYYALSPKGAHLMDAQYDQTTIPPMQGAYVIAKASGAQIKLDYAKHVYKADPSNTAMRAPQKRGEDFKRVRLQVIGQNSGADRMYVIQHDEATRGYDNGYDAKNIPVEGQVNIYATEQAGEMEISVSDKIDSTYIGFNAGSDTQYTLRLTSVVGEKMLLKDMENETVIAVEDEVVYTFSATPNSVNKKRFLLLDQLAGEDVEDLVKVYIYDNVVYVLEAPKGSDMAVYTVGGLLMARYAVGETPCTVALSDLPTGIYVVRIADKAVKFVCK